MKKSSWFLFLCIWFSTNNLAISQAQLQPFFRHIKSFSNPLGLVKAPGQPGKIYVVEQKGMIYCLDENKDTKAKTVFLDFRKAVSQSGNETGLLGLAFHPKFAQNGLYYLSYTSGSGKNLVSHIAEMKANSTQMKGSSKVIPRILISVNQPYTNHNGGAIAFGPDGYLYFSWGDGGAGGDPQNNAQNLGVLFGKIHRIDVNQSSKERAYGIPADNPFVSNPNARPEIFAYGLRNVWQMHWDVQTKKLWAGDVGQNAHEEIDVIEKGKNYGWRIMEGNSIYKADEVKSDQNLTPPIFSYPQKEGNQSITGGMVYRGKHKEWQGKCIYGDFMSGRIWVLNTDGTNNTQLIDKRSPRHSISCFGRTATGEILVVDYGNGVIYLLTPNP